MTEREALMRAICESPDDDTPRLVFADWLDEHGEPERAEFIRAQIELTRDYLTMPARSRLHKRVLALRRANEKRWGAELPYPGTLWSHGFERGFVEAVTVNDVGTFIREAPVIFASVPITTLRIHHDRPGLLCGVHEMARVRYLEITCFRPEPDSVRAFALASNISGLEQLSVLGPTIDFDIEDLLAERFGAKLYRGMPGI